MSLWFRDGEAITSIKTIPDLIHLLEYKVRQSNSIDSVFIIYSRPEGRSTIQKRAITNFNMYLSFALVEGHLVGSAFSTFNPRDYTLLDSSVCVWCATRGKPSMRQSVTRPLLLLRGIVQGPKLP